MPDRRIGKANRCDHAALANATAFKCTLEPLHKAEWVVYAKQPFAGPGQVLAYLARYTHRVAISNSRLVSADHKGVTFTFKDYRLSGPQRYKTMTLPNDEFIRRFLLHVLPKGFHRIRHYGFLANGNRAENLDRARTLLNMPGHNQAADPASPDEPDEPGPHLHPCPKCGRTMVIIDTFGPVEIPLKPQAEAGTANRHLQSGRPTAARPTHALFPATSSPNPQQAPPWPHDRQKTCPRPSSTPAPRRNQQLLSPTGKTSANLKSP